MRAYSIVLLSILLLGCSEPETSTNSAAGLEAELKQVQSWPHSVVGVLDIIDAGGYGDSDDPYPDWAVGSLTTPNDEYGVLIEIGAGVVRKARIDIDSGKPVHALLGAPKDMDGMLSYPVLELSPANQ